MKSIKGSEKNDNFLIVGLGASAGGLETFRDFFQALPNDSGMAFVLIQHLDPTHKSLLAELLTSFTQMKVTEIEDGALVQPENVYVIPPNKDLEILNGKLHLLTPHKDRAQRRPIDSFFRSLAQDQKEKAVGIILSGTGTEGALGLRYIKGEGGLTMAQDPETAKFDGMPRSAVEADVVDVILPVMELSEQLVKYARNRTLNSTVLIEEVAFPKNELEKIYILLRNASKCNFSNYKTMTVVRRINKRMALHQISKLKDYLKYLQEKPKEVEALFNDLLIGVTSFFRDPEAFEILSEKGISSIISAKSSGDTIRVWIPGCSTGEETYSIAILLDEAIRAQKKDLRFQIFASDINEKAINSARLGIYPESHSSQISKERLKRYFQVDLNSFRIKKEIRDKVIFATQNVISDPPFSKLDMISCRNLLIYINPSIQQKIFKIFNYALNPKGLLFLGNSESLGESANLFSTIDRKFKLFTNKAVNSVLPLEFDEYTTEPLKQKENTSSLKINQLNVGIGEITEKLLLTKYAPACAIINKKGDAIYFSGNTEKYLKPLQGKASLNITELAREGLAAGLRNTIDKARKSNKEVESNNLMVRTNGIIQTLKLIVKPITQFDLDENYFMVIFEDQNETEIANITSKNENKNETFTEILALEQELISTKEFLQSTIEELEGSNQELKTSYEELQSANEELQSSNEELETSKEELQSMNEEMITVNNELQLKNNELAQSYGDMNNLLATTQIGTLFLDRELKIRRFTPCIVKIINIITSDIGRPMIDLSLNIQYASFIKDIKKVLEQLEPIQRVVNGKDNLSYLVRIIPYLSSENSVDGVVITFVDITKEMESAAKEKEVALKYKDLLKHTKSYIYKQDKQLKYIEFFAFENGWLSEDIIGKNESDVIKSKIDADNLIKLKNKVMKTGIPIIKEIIITVNDKISYYNLLIRPWLNNEKEIQGVACIASDITEFKTTEANLAKN